MMTREEKLPLLAIPRKTQSKVGCFERRRRRKLKEKFYQEQAELMENFERDDQLLDGYLEPYEEERRVDRILNAVLFCLNICLLFANVAAAVLSGSLSIVSTAVDSAMDLSTSVILGVCMHLVRQADEYEYPRGRQSLEMLGVILCSVIMGIANMVIIMQSVEAVAQDSIHPDMNAITFLILISGCTLKFILMLICFKRGTAPSRVLAMDMRNDLATSFVAIIAAFIGDRYWKYADPLGACIVCGIIAVSWFHHALMHIPSMTGVRGEQENLARILRIAIEHDDRITKIDHVMMYHIGQQCIVEMHIVMNENLPLKITHDISHPLEKKLNQLEFVARSFVHCDYHCDGD